MKICVQAKSEKRNSLVFERKKNWGDNKVAGSMCALTCWKWLAVESTLD